MSSSFSVIQLSLVENSSNFLPCCVCRLHGIGFDITVMHPHSVIIQSCDIIRGQCLVIGSNMNIAYLYNTIRCTIRKHL